MGTDPTTLGLLGVGLILTGAALCWKAAELAETAAVVDQGDEHDTTAEGDGADGS